jgi:lactoylglutathione lyase
MRLNHLNLTVTDVGEASAFLDKYFGLQPLSGGNDGFTVLMDEDEFVLTLMRAGKRTERVLI